MSRMDLSEYITSTSERQQLADACGTDPAYLWQIATGWRGRKASVDLAKRIEAATDGRVTRYDLRPDIFGDPTKREVA